MKTRVISVKNEDDPSGDDNYFFHDDEEKSSAECSDTSDVAYTPWRMLRKSSHIAKVVLEECTKAEALQNTFFMLLL